MRIGCLLAGIVIGVAAPGLARSDPAMYSGSIHLRLFGGRQVPYGALLSGPGLNNSPSSDMVSLVGNGPAGFALLAGQLALTTFLVDPSPPYTSLDYRRTTFSGANAAGSFFGGGAPSAAGFAPVPAIPAGQFGASFSGEPDRFGGVMKLLGSFDWRGELANCDYCPYHTVFPLSPIGGPFGGTATATTYVGGTAFPPTLVAATVWGFPWDTGSVGAVAAVAGTASSTTTAAMGTDLRTPSGLGTLQLVSPFLVRVKSLPPLCSGCASEWFYAGMARAELRFVPEPAATFLFATGLAGLGVLRRQRKQREP